MVNEITELELSLHNGEITLFDYLEEKKEKETSELDKAKGLTPRMRAYCRKHGLNGISDLNVVWKKPRQSHVWCIHQKDLERINER